MGDKTEEQNHEVEAKHQSESEPSTMTMSEIETPQDEGKPSLETLKKLESFCFSIWPPTQKTRDAVIERLIATLSSPSILSKRYGTIPRGNASDIAMRIEEEAFNAAGASANADGADGIEIVQVYSKEVSKRMLEGIKSRSADSPPPEIVPERESVPAPQESNKLYALLETVAPEAAP
ncbi:MFP1 attachment factor 1-like [Ipomoea triloba]|uniref:MFP1 attachment factor 1-like n=1 Tax=Ipomoea triloba TaxID=35885 RepID=UPI00125E0F29|nr:MFP1 attachment factor 1-like [Ipomoea triloba]